jgi:hypothetical protein
MLLCILSALILVALGMRAGLIGPEQDGEIAVYQYGVASD